jgi:hypothetical protein
MEAQAWSCNTCMEQNHGHTRRSSSSASLKSSENLHHHHYQAHCGTWSVCVSAIPGCLLTEPSKCVLSPMVLHRPMTSPVEGSSSSSDRCVAKCRVKSLRKILDDQASLQPNSRANKASSFSIYRSRLRAPPFLPRSPASVAEAGTSTATASISRFLTKGTHSSSTRPPSPPLQSAMKRSPPSSTSLSSIHPSPTLTHSNPIVNTLVALSFPKVVVTDLGGGNLNTPSSGMSTPRKRISFADLPESYASTRPNGSSSFKFKDKHNRRKRENGAGGKEQNSPERTGGSNGYGLNMTHTHQEEMSEWTSKNWGERMGAGFSNELDIWA